MVEYDGIMQYYLKGIVQSLDAFEDAVLDTWRRDVTVLEELKQRTSLQFLDFFDDKDSFFANLRDNDGKKRVALYTDYLDWELARVEVDFFDTYVYVEVNNEGILFYLQNNDFSWADNILKEIFNKVFCIRKKGGLFLDSQTFHEDVILNWSLSQIDKLINKEELYRYYTKDWIWDAHISFFNRNSVKHKKRK